MAIATAPTVPALPALEFRKATLQKQVLMPTWDMGGAALDGRYSREVDSKGYLAGFDLELSGTETTATADPTANEDFPYRLWETIEVSDTGGGTIIKMDGYSAFLAAMYFGYRRRTGTRGSTSADIEAVAISSVTVNNLRTLLHVDVENNPRDNLELLPNQNASFKYNLVMEARPEADVVTTVANATWAAVVTPIYRYYTIPAPVRADGRPQEVRPPFLGVVRQQIAETRVVPSNAENRYDLEPGKVFRNLILVSRDTPVRENGITKVVLKYGDDVTLKEWTGQGLRSAAFEQFGLEPPTGVYPINFDNDGATPGLDHRRDYLDARALSQIYLLVTTTGDIDELTIVRDELIVPAGISL